MNVNLAELSERVRTVVDDRGTAGSTVPPPQAIFPMDAAEPWEVYPWRRAAGTAPPEVPDLHFTVSELLSLDDERFLIRCFQALLWRDPSAAEADAWSARLREGRPRLLALAAIRYSREGRERSVPVRGLLRAVISGAVRLPFRRMLAVLKRT